MTWVAGELVTAAMMNVGTEGESRWYEPTIPSCEGCGARAVEKGRCAYCGAKRG